MANEPAPLTPQPWFTRIDKKVWAGGVGGLLSWFLFAACSSWFGIDLGAMLQPVVNIVAGIFFAGPPPSAQGALAILIGTGVGYVVPATYADVYRRLNSRVIAQAALDPAKPDVSVPQIISAVQDVVSTAGH